MDLQPLISTNDNSKLWVKKDREATESLGYSDREDKMTPENSRNKMGNIIGDLRVLSEKCNRDVDSKYPFNYRYYRKELNRIIAELAQVNPEVVGNVNTISDASVISHSPGSMSAEQDAKLREISAVTDKLLSRLGQGVEEDVRPILVLEKLFNRFHQVARQLRSRHDERPTLDISDEYDVQDLLHSLLKLYFDDIRPEEWTPSYAGGSSRMDFLLKNEQLVVEVKKTRDNLRDRLIGEQLIVDIARYKEHPDCKTLVCFIYDAEGLIANPTGLESDLNAFLTDRLSVRAYVFPK